MRALAITQSNCVVLRFWQVLRDEALACYVLAGVLLASPPVRADDAVWIRSAGSGAWSAETTWGGGKVPAAGARVHVRSGHAVAYDVKSEVAIRAICVAGTLSFAPDRDTRLDVGVIKIQAGDEPSEDGFAREAHLDEADPDAARPALEVGTPERPIEAGHSAVVRLVYFDGQDKQSCPAIVCCGGRMEFHGARMSRTWVKLGATARKGDATITLAERVTGWCPGDRVIVTATRLGRDTGQGTDRLETEERVIRVIEEIVTDGDRVLMRLYLDRPLEREHVGDGEFRGEVANLSRNVVVESAEPDGVRGHTMYHRGSAGSISYAEFRHLGKRDTLGRYSLHFHLVGDTMRGSSVVGASIHDSHNRWLTIHGTNYLVVRDCVGFRSVGHGFFLEDGTEVDNILDRNLAVQAMQGKPLPKQVLPFDHNEGAGFWWANSHNTFTRNVTCENDRYGYRFEATETSRLKPTLPVRGRDGETRDVDIRTLPFVRFADNEAHSDGLYGVNLGDGVNRVGPDARHPFVMRNTRIWEVHYGFRPQSPSLLVENLTLNRTIYGVYHPNFDRHVYRDVTISQSGPAGDAEPFNRGHDDLSVQYGTLTVDGLVFSGHRFSSMPLIQISDDNPTGVAESHFRRVQVTDRKDNDRRALVNLGGGPRPQPKTPTSVPVFIHDYYGAGRHAKVVSTRSGDVRAAPPSSYRSDPPLTGDESRVVEVTGVEFPKLLDPVDDEPPATIITRVARTSDGWLVRGSATDNGTVRQVTVNGTAAKSLRGDFAEWQAQLRGADLPRSQPSITAAASDAAGNVENQPHVLRIPAAK